MNLFEVIWKSSRAIDGDECLFCGLSYSFKAKHLQQNEVEDGKDKPRLRAEVLRQSPRLVSTPHMFGHLLQSDLWIFLRLLIIKPWCCSIMDFVPWLKVSPPIEATRMALHPSLPLGPPVASEASTIDAWHETHPHWQNKSFSEWHITKNHDTHVFTTMVQCTYLWYIICILYWYIYTVLRILNETFINIVKTNHFKPWTNSLNPNGWGFRQVAWKDGPALLHE